MTGTRSHRQSRRVTGTNPKIIGNLSPRTGSRGASPRHVSAVACGQQRSRQSSNAHNIPSRKQSTSSVGGGTVRHGLAVAASGVNVGGGGGGTGTGCGTRRDMMSAWGSARVLSVSSNAALSSARGAFCNDQGGPVV